MDRAYGAPAESMAQGLGQPAFHNGRCSLWTADGGRLCVLSDSVVSCMCSS